MQHAIIRDSNNASARMAIAALVTALSCMVSPIASASAQMDARVTAISAGSAGPYLVLAKGGRTAKPACATDEYWAISNPTDENAKAMFALVVNARANGLAVSIVGTGICDVSHPNRETVNYIIAS